VFVLASLVPSFGLELSLIAHEHEFLTDSSMVSHCIVLHVSEAVLYEPIPDHSTEQKPANAEITPSVVCVFREPQPASTDRFTAQYDHK
jgi:hypothetical protein